MEKITEFRAKVMPTFKFVVDDREFKLVLDYNAIAKIESELTRDMRQWSDWTVKSEKNPDGLTGSDISFICWACFDRFHPEVTLREVRQWLTPTDIDHIWLTLIEMCFPGITEAIEQAAKLKAAEGGASGENQPAVQGRPSESHP
jgi:hypothetical protein